MSDAIKRSPDVLRKRFLEHISNKWFCHNTYNANWKGIPEASGVYVFIAFNYQTLEKDIVYIGSSANLKLRYKAHKVPAKIQQLSEHNCSVLFFIEMEKNFYDYEMKLIDKLKPYFNTQHKKIWH